MSKWDVVVFINKKMRSGRYRILKKEMWVEPIELPDDISLGKAPLSDIFREKGITPDSRPIEVEVDPRVINGKSIPGYIYICGMDTGEPIAELHIRP